MRIQKPKAIKPGDTIGIVSPSSPIEPATLEKGLKHFQERGYKIEIAKHALDRNAYLAGTDQHRADDLHEMFERTDIDAVICSRGGFGAARLMPYLKPEVFRNNPKLFAGYSDVTVLNLWLLQTVGLSSFYSPMPITFSRDIPKPVADQMWQAFESAEPLGKIHTFENKIKTVSRGKVRGLVTGGCLCLIAYSLGTPFEIDTKDKIVIIEDVDEAPYRIDGMLTQLGQAGKISSAAGFVIGEDTRWEEYIDKEKPQESFTPDELWIDRLEPYKKPIITGFPFGHVEGPLTLPIGIEAELDADAGTLTYLESGVE